MPAKNKPTRIRQVPAPNGSSITPWSPPPGLSLALLFVFGLRWQLYAFIVTFACFWPIYLNAARAMHASSRLQVQTLAQSGRGGWRATLDSGAVVELGSGTPQELVQRAQRFVRTVTSVAAHYGRRVDALESADLRYPSGYALRLRGVSTVTEGAPPGAKPKNGKSGQRGQSENSDKGRH